MCSGRVDLAFVLRAFSNGMDGVFIGGCHLNECHYITDGNHHAFTMVQICKKMLAQIGLIDATKLPVTGAEQAARLLDPSLPSNTLIPKG